MKAPLLQRGPSFLLATLSTFAEPEEVGVDEEEEDHGAGHEVHIEAEQNASVVEVPAALHAAGGIERSPGAAEGGEQEQGVGAQVREVRNENGSEDADEDQGVATGQGVLARVEEGRGQHFQYATDTAPRVIRKRESLQKPQATFAR